LPNIKLLLLPELDNDSLETIISSYLSAYAEYESPLSM